MGLVDETTEPPAVSPLAQSSQGRTEFEDVYRSAYRRVYAVAYALTGSAATAEDIVQDSLLEAFRRWTKIEDYEDPVGWVRRVAINKCVSLHRRLTAETAAVTRLGTLPSYQPSLPRSEERLWAAVRQLPQRQAQAIALHYLEDLPVREIATVIGCSTSSVKVHLRRGRATLSTKIDREDER